MRLNGRLMHTGISWGLVLLLDKPCPCASPRTPCLSLSLSGCWVHCGILLGIIPNYRLRRVHWGRSRVSIMRARLGHLQGYVEHNIAFGLMACPVPSRTLNDVPGISLFFR